MVIDFAGLLFSVTSLTMFGTNCAILKRVDFYRDSLSNAINIKAVKMAYSLCKDFFVGAIL